MFWGLKYILAAIGIPSPSYKQPDAQAMSSSEEFYPETNIIISAGIPIEWYKVGIDASSHLNIALVNYL